MLAPRLSRSPLDLEALCAELGVEAAFPPEVIAAAEQVAQRTLPDAPGTADATEVPLVTIDPTGSMDLDQALAIERRDGGGWIVFYAIADVAAFVEPGGPIDIEARRRGETLYAPGRRVPLYPDVLGQSAMSLLPNVGRPALLWRIEVDADGRYGSYSLRRATVRSRAKLDYVGVQAAIDAGTLPDAIAELPALGTARHTRAVANGAIELNLPEQQVEDHNGVWTLDYRTPLDAELWNAQVSLLTGSVAARIMLDGRIGLLRTLPPAPNWVVEKLRRAAPALQVSWPEANSPGQVLASLDLNNPKHVAFVELASTLLRGAGYTSFDGTQPDQADHAGIGGPYAHVTAPIRRLCDRYANEVCVALMAGSPVPMWARSVLAVVPEWMAASGKLSHTFDRAILDGTEAAVLAPRVGQDFAAVVVEVDDKAKRGTVTLDEVAVSARCDGEGLPLGERVKVHLETADVSTRTVRFTYPA